MESGQARTVGGLPGAPFSALHAAHRPLEVLQTGVLGVRLQLRFVVHWTHLFVERLQSGFCPEHWPLLLHSRH